MSDSIDSVPLTGLSVFTKEDEDHSVGVVEDVEEESGSLIVRGNLDLRKYSIPRDTVVGIDPTNEKLILDMTRDDFIEYEK
ncbi:MAG: hypothetical protein ABI361_09725 [Nitrososphaera sp.]|jgi:hypothetical protein